MTWPRPQGAHEAKQQNWAPYCGCQRAAHRLAPKRPNVQRATPRGQGGPDGAVLQPGLGAPIGRGPLARANLVFDGCGFFVPVRYRLRGPWLAIDSGR